MPVPSLNSFFPGIGVVSADGLNTFVQGGCLVTDLRAFAGLANMTIYILGTGSANDGGQGSFYWNGTVTGTDDNGATTIVPYGSTQGCWLRLGGGLSAVNSVPTIAALRSMAGQISANNVWVEGYYAAGDGGEGTFTQGGAGTDNGGTVIVDASGRTWYRAVEGSVLTVLQFGADPTGAVDCTQAIIAMVAWLGPNGGVINYPPGTYAQSPTIVISTGISIVGQGTTTTTIQTSAATGDLFQFTGQGGSVRSMNFSATTTRTSGAYVNFTITSSDVFIRDFSMTGHYFGIVMSAGADAIIDSGRMINSSGVFGSSGILIDGGNDQHISHVEMNNDSAHIPSNGISIVATGALNMDNCDIINCGADLHMTPGPGQVVASVWAEQCFFDTASVGISIEPTGGTVVRCRFTSCWASSHSLVGVFIANNGAGSVDGIEFIDLHCFGNVNNNFQVGSPCINIRILGGAFCGSAAGSGIEIEANVTYFSIVGAFCGTGFGFGPNARGINIEAGASNHYMITDCMLLGNTGGALVNAGSGTQIVIANNLLA